MTMRQYYLGFSLTPGIGPARLRRLLESFPTLEEAWNAPPQSLRQAGLDESSLTHLLEARQRLRLGEELARLQDLGIGLLTWDDPDYPERLRHIYAPPPVLYLRGSLLPGESMVSIVGTRRPTTYGREVARRLARDLARNGITVVSGLAIGIDTEAHQSALEAGGRTVAVLACGLDTVYPARNRALAERIAAQGSLLSDYPPGTPPDPRNFPPRNRIISGLSLGVVVVEAGERSGALITSDFAAEQGREVFAVPGSVFSPSSRGCNALIAQGARLVRDVDDILEELNLTRAAEQMEARRAMPESEEEAAVLELLSAEPVHIDELGRSSGLSISVISSALTLMELKGLVRHVGGMQYVRV